MQQIQVYSAQEVEFGNYVKVFFGDAFGGDGSVVPPNSMLEISTLTLNFFPTKEGTMGRADIAGRNAANLGTGDAVWRLQVVYVEPKKTMHLTFPTPLRLQAGGHIELGFVNEGPGTIFLDVNGLLIKS